MICLVASFSSIIQDGIYLHNLVTAFCIFILIYPQKEVWLDGPTHFGLKKIFFLDFDYPEENFYLFDSLHAYSTYVIIRKSVARILPLCPFNRN